MAIDQIYPTHLVDALVHRVFIGWHILDGDESDVLFFLQLNEDRYVEAWTAGDGSLALRQRAALEDLSMEELGRFEFRPAERDHPAALLDGQTILSVDRINWNDTEVGLRLSTAGGVVVLANDFDEVFCSNGPLPLAFADATIH